MGDKSIQSIHGTAHVGDGMLSGVLQHYARYQNKKTKRRGDLGDTDGNDDSITGTAAMVEVDSIYRSSINGRYMSLLLVLFKFICYSSLAYVFLVELNSSLKIRYVEDIFWHFVKSALTQKICFFSLKSRNLGRT